MNTYQTIEEARTVAWTNRAVAYVLEIDSPQGRCFINCTVDLATMARALKASPMPEITKLVAQHPVNRPLTLWQQRERLNAAALDCLSYWTEAGEYRRGRGDLAAAEKALADFDAAHPEVMATVRAERDAAAERHMAYD